jgi:hypothetical protein
MRRWRGRSCRAGSWCRSASLDTSRGPESRCRAGGGWPPPAADQVDYRGGQPPFRTGVHAGTGERSFGFVLCFSWWERGAFPTGVHQKGCKTKTPPVAHRRGESQQDHQNPRGTPMTADTTTAERLEKPIQVPASGHIYDGLYWSRVALTPNAGFRPRGVQNCTRSHITRAMPAMLTFSTSATVERGTFRLVPMQAQLTSSPRRSALITPKAPKPRTTNVAR